MHKTLQEGSILYRIHPEIKSYAVAKKDVTGWEQVMTEYVNRFITEAFGKMPKIEVTVNNRLCSTNGRFKSYHGSKDYYAIEISGKVLTSITLLGETDECMRYLESLLRHEAIHYALWHLDESHHDGMRTFEQALWLTNTHPSGATPDRYVYKTVIESIPKQKYIGECPECHTQGAYSSRGRYYCLKCKQKGKRSIFRPKDIAVGVARDVKRGDKDIEENIHSKIRSSFKGTAPIKSRA